MVILTNPDIIILPGDIPTSLDLPVLIYSYIKGRREEYVKQLYQRFAERLAYKQIKSVKKILLKLVKFKKPILLIHGNTELEVTRNWMELFAHRFPNLHWISDKSIKINNKVFVGHGFIGVPHEYQRGKSPGEIDTDEDFRKLNFAVNRAKIEHPDVEDVILISHAPPYNTKIDYLPHKKYHAGSINVRMLLDKGEISKIICGHLHESYGIQKTEKWWILNAGSVIEDVTCTVDLDTGHVLWYKGISNRITFSSLLYRRRNSLKYDKMNE